MNQYHFQGEMWMRHQLGQTDQLDKHIFQRAVPGRFAPPQHGLPIGS